MRLSRLASAILNCLPLKKFFQDFKFFESGAFLNPEHLKKNKFVYTGVDFL